MKKALPYIFLALLVIVALAVKRCNYGVGSWEPGKPADNVNRNRGLDRRVAF